jgi:hypothetical protein
MQSEGLEITKEKLMAGTGISEHESDWILTVFSSFYNFYMLFFKILKRKNLENKNTYKKSAYISVKKKSIEFLSDYMNLFKNKPVGMKRFKNEFFHLYEISKKIPELFTITNSTIKISNNGLKLSQKVNKYNKIGRNPPKEVVFGDMKIQITD